MYGYRPRTGPSKTPANVQCQKCLKRGHYSYECKAAPQERPYVARPSRTQQLFNPKLRPKLASETPNALQDSKGVADEELAKRAAERARKREREVEEDDALRDSPPPRRRRSPSYDSVSSISSRSPSPAAKRSRTPERRERRRQRLLPWSLGKPRAWLPGPFFKRVAFPFAAPASVPSARAQRP
ncbi:hypothetical protein VTH06DRAFT_2304 [Thermothelomyces fergusii]